MKKPLLISLTALAVLGVTTATTLYAQTATGSSVIARMKAAAAAFTLSADLNPGQTGYESAPLSGKKTGNMLTAAEWNRMLELVAQGGTGSGGGAGWENVPLTDATDFNTNCLYRFQTGGNAYATLMGNSPYYIVNAVSPTQLTWWLDMGGSDIRHISSTSKTKYRINGVEYAASGGITKIEKLCGGGNSSTGTSTPTASNLTYINPDNTDFAPLDCTPGMNYLINPIAFSATSASTYTDKKIAVLKTGNWTVKGTNFSRNRNITSSTTHTLRVSTVLDSTVTHLINNTVDVGLYASSFSSPVAVPAGKTVELRASLRNNVLYGGNIVAWCTN